MLRKSHLGDTAEIRTTPLDKRCDYRIFRGMMDPARTVIEICGGVDAVAAMTGRSKNRVRRWGYPKEQGGTGGLIPSDCQQLIMAAALTNGLPLLPSHFFRLPQTSEDAA